MHLEAPPLLRTKLDLPAPQPRTLPRERLQTVLRRTLGTRLLLLSAPAGFGKTTLLASHCRSLQQQGQTAVGWLTLDEHDNRPGHLIAYLLAAVAQAAALPAEQVWPDAEAPWCEEESALTRLINMLAALERDCVLVLDDYQRISAPAAHAAVAFLLEHLPSRVCLAIGTRADPPLPLARLRARAQLAELRANNLRFSPDEIQRFFQMMGTISLSSAEARAVEAYVEGWPAGAQLVAQALKPGGPAAPQGRFSARLEESKRAVFAYLADDVFEQQPAHLKSFLLQTALLERMCGPLCDAVLGIRDERLEIDEPARSDSYSELVLGELERNNLFVARDDDERHWYRYHRLFRAFLLARLEHEPPSCIAELQRRANAWYLHNNMPTSGAAHAAEGGSGAPLELFCGKARGKQLLASPYRRSPAEVLVAARVAGTESQPYAERFSWPYGELVETLSEREREVLLLIASGASNHAIAEQLVISIGTVKSHVNHILGKLAAHSRTEAVAHAHALGLL